MSALPSLRPVRRLEGLLGPIDDLLPAALHVEDLEHAADVVAIRHEAVFRGTDEPDILEDRPLGHVGIVRAEREPDEHLITEADVRDFGGRERLAELRRREDVGLALPLDLNDVRALDGRLDLLGDRAFGAPELQRREAVAVHHAVDIRSVGVLAGAHHQAHLAVGVDALAEELDARLQDEIAGHALPDELELVFLRPHVHAACGKGVLLRDGVVRGGAGDLRRADVAMSIELAEWGALAESREARERDDGRHDRAGAQGMTRQV